MPTTFRRILNTAARAPDVDVEQRILRGITVATRALAADGYILEPSGIEFEGYLRDPQVRAMHIAGDRGEGRSPVIGRALAFAVGDRELLSEAQFADTELGREYAYLYGVNPAREVYMRAWSVNVNLLESRPVGRDEALRLAGDLWDEEVARKMAAEGRSVVYAPRSRMVEYSAVVTGADRHALTRAWTGGVSTAGHILAELDLAEALDQIADLKQSQRNLTSQLEGIENDLQALRRDGAAAAARGDTAEILDLLNGLARSLKP